MALALSMLAAIVPVSAREDRAALLERRLAGPDGSVMVVAHRGCWKATSENSIDAVKACIAAGIDMVELDVRATRDGMLVLMHDASVDRMTDGTGKVAEMDWASLRKLHLRAGAGRTTPVTKRRIPTLEEALRAAKGRILINIDAKSMLSASILDLIDRAGTRGQILFKAEAPVARIEAEAPWARTVRFQPILRQPNMRDPAAMIASYAPLHPVSYEIDVKDAAFTASLTPMIRAQCARYWVNSLSGRVFDDRVAVTNPDQVWGKLVALGVDAIQTDEPEMLKAYLQRIRATSYRCEPTGSG